MKSGKLVLWSDAARCTVYLCRVGWVEPFARPNIDADVGSREELAPPYSIQSAKKTGLTRELMRLGTFARSGFGERREHAGLERGLRYRLEHLFVHPETHRLKHAPTLRIARQHDDWHIRIRVSGPRAQAAHELRGLHSGYAPIEQHHVGLKGMNGLEPAHRLRGLMDLSAAHGLQEAADALAGMIFMIDDQNLGARDQSVAVVFVRPVHPAAPPMR